MQYINVSERIYFFVLREKSELLDMPRPNIISNMFLYNKGIATIFWPERKFYISVRKDEITFFYGCIYF